MYGEASPRDVRVDSGELPEGTTLLDRYVIGAQVASGGMATIHRAHDARLDRVVCVKLLRVLLRDGTASNAEVVYRLGYKQFLQEALSLSKLQHPNTLRIYDFGYLEDGRPFQISEYLDGGNLDESLRDRGPLGVAEALAIIEPITGALTEAHGHGIIHRDIKPSNILFSLAGGVKLPKLADFGIALRELCEPVASDAERAPAPRAESQSTVTLFSPRWAAPEQLTKSGEGPFTDVYALALTVASLLGGRPLFHDSAIRQTFGRRVADDALVEERLMILPISPSLRKALRDALTADVTRRTKTPTALLDALRSAADETAPRMPAGPLSAPRRPLDSITLARAFDLRGTVRGDEADETRFELGDRVLRLVTIGESLDVIVPAVRDGGDAREVRFRVALLPGTTHAHRLHVKSLNGFLRKLGGTPSAAATSESDGGAEFLDGNRAPLATCRWSFATATHTGHTFRIDGIDMEMPVTERTPVVALAIAGEREIIVLTPA